MPLSSEGLTIKRFPEILEELNAELKSNLNSNIDTSENSVAGILNSLLSNALSDLWELSQGVYDSFDVLRAEGDALENLALLVGFIRRASTPTRGIAQFTGVNGTLVPADSEMLSVRSDVFINPNDVLITSLDSIAERLKLTVVSDTGLYRTKVDGTTFDYQAVALDDLQDILVGINTALAPGSGVFTTAIVTDTSDLTDLTTNYIQITKDDATTTMEVNSTSNIIFTDVVTIDPIESKEKGFIPGDLGTITTISTAVNGWTSIFNPTDFPLGDDEETDDELRFRIQDGFETVGSATPDTIVSRILGVTDVEACIIIENTDIIVDVSTGLNPKSYELVVEGGEEQAIGDEIWATKPAGIEVFNNTAASPNDETVTVIDFNGQEQTVFFTRPTTQFAFMRISYTDFDEEIKPVNADEIIKDVCLSFGDDLSIGEDIIPQRFIGEIYRNVAGIEDIIVEVDIALTATPTPPYPGTFTEDRIPIDQREVSSFATVRIEVNP